MIASNLLSTTEPAAVRRDQGHYRCEGRWTLAGIEALDAQLQNVRWANGALQLDGSGIRAIDTTGALQLLNLVAALERDGRRVQLVGLHEEHRELLELVRERRAAAGEPPPTTPPRNRLERLGRWVLHHLRRGGDFLAFVGEAALALGQLLLHPRRFRWRALFGNVETAGIHALPIVALLAFMMGVVIAYQGGRQLEFYGANIFIVELVSLTMLRELAPLITAIIVAGRTGSSYTAQIGTM
ncbi:MAG TPA: ABC transporter permease, partial [Candidatus Competibacter phosphatis]|nr:ABC transporter permease [Candidatus Competibacter phosphatis]HMR03744.1 ABC transporter permease [Candidatus Competibacter phosphatis]